MTLHLLYQRRGDDDESSSGVRITGKELTRGDWLDVDGRDVLVELTALSRRLAAGSQPPYVLKFIWGKGGGFFSNVIVALRLLLAVPETVSQS